MNIFFCTLLGICAIHDCHSKTIPVSWIWGSLCLAVIYRLTILISGLGSITESMLCLMPGVFLLILSRYGKMVGNGDGWLIIAVGLFFEWSTLMWVLCYSFLVAGLFSIGCLLTSQKKRGDTIPFAPFLFAGMMISVVGDMI